MAKRKFGDVWTFRTKRFEVRLTLERDYRYKYDGDDPDGGTQAALDSGAFVAFDSCVTVFHDGEQIAWDSLGGSVYAADSVSEFYTAHRGVDPMNRNCSVMRTVRGNAVICHYFPDMVRNAVSAARQYVRDMPPKPYIRESAQ